MLFWLVLVLHCPALSRWWLSPKRCSWQSSPGHTSTCLVSISVCPLWTSSFPRPSTHHGVQHLNSGSSLHVDTSAVTRCHSVTELVCLDPVTQLSLTSNSTATWVQASYSRSVSTGARQISTEVGSKRRLHRTVNCQLIICFIALMSIQIGLCTSDGHF